MKLIVLILLITISNSAIGKPPIGTFNFRHFGDNKSISNISNRVYNKNIITDRNCCIGESTAKWNGYGFYVPELYINSGQKWNGYGFYIPELYIDSGQKWNGYGHYKVPK